MVLKQVQMITSLLSLDKISDNVFRSHGPHIEGPNKLYGGYITAQVYEAVRRLRLQKEDENKLIFSIHYNFVSAGEVHEPIDIKINKFEKVYAINISQKFKNIGLAHVKVENLPMESFPYPPDVPGVTNISDVETLIKSVPENQKNFYKFLMTNNLFEVRPNQVDDIPAPGDFRVNFYARVTPEAVGHIREDGGMAILICLSDFLVLRSFENVLRQFGLLMEKGASLHHKLYFHQKRTEATQWFFVQSRTEIVTGNKVRVFGSIFDSNKNCVVSFIQEAYVVAKNDKSLSKI